MTIKEYIKKVIEEFVEAEGDEVTGNKNIEFDIGLRCSPTGVEVSNDSSNRIKFTLMVKRS